MVLCVVYDVAGVVTFNFRQCWLHLNWLHQWFQIQDCQWWNCYRILWNRWCNSLVRLDRMPCFMCRSPNIATIPIFCPIRSARFTRLSSFNRSLPLVFFSKSPFWSDFQNFTKFLAEWSNWSEWGECVDGNHSRSRTCENETNGGGAVGAECAGAATEECGC